MLSLVKERISHEGQEGRRPQEEDAVPGSISRTDPANVMWESGPQITAETHRKASVCLQNHPSERSKSALAPLHGSQTIAHIDFGSSSSCEVITVQLCFQTVSFGDSTLEIDARLLAAFIDHHALITSKSGYISYLLSKNLKF